jgi:hypothetical protein
MLFGVGHGSKEQVGAAAANRGFVLRRLPKSSCVLLIVQMLFGSLRT